MMRFLLIVAMVGLLTPWVSAGAAVAPQPAQPPNIVIIAFDACRASHLSCYGYARPTSPNIDKLATQGVRFERCYSVASWTLPSFTSMFTGVLPAVHGVTQSSLALSDKIPTITQKLHDKGYFTAAVVSNPLLNAKYGFGRGFDKYDDYTIFLDAELALFAADGSREQKSVNELVTGALVTEQATRLIAAGKKSGKPCFLFVHYFDPHDSYVPKQAYRRWANPNYLGPISGHGVAAMRLSPPTKKADMDQLQALYDGEIAYDDNQLGKLLKEIDTTFDPAHTVVIFLSDHGEAFGEHGMLTHGNSPYREETWVPMIWRWKGVLPAGQVVSSPVAMMDLAPTLRDLLHLEGLQNMQGQTLWPQLLGEAAKPEDIFTQKALDTSVIPGRHIALTRGSYRLHVKFKDSPKDQDARFELYDIGQDPWEQKNLMVQMGHDANIQSMRQSLMRIWDQSQALRASYQQDPAGIQAPLSEKERQRIDGLGYTRSAPTQK